MLQKTISSLPNCAFKHYLILDQTPSRIPNLLAGIPKSVVDNPREVRAGKRNLRSTLRIAAHRPIRQVNDETAIQKTLRGMTLGS